MIDDDILSSYPAKSIIATITIYHSSFLVSISHSEAEITNNDIVATQRNRIIGETDTITGSCLSRYCNITPDRKLCLKMDRTGDRKNNDSFPFCFGRFAETTGTIVFQISYNVHFSTSPAGCIFPKTFCPGECN